MPHSGETASVAMIGLGNMGVALAESLLADKHNLTVWNRTQSKADALVNAGASASDTPHGAIGAADIVIVCLLDDASTREVFEHEATAAVLNGKNIVQLSTVTAGESRAFGGWLNEKGAAYLDGSILAYPEMIRDGQGTIVYSGPREAFTYCHRALKSMGGKAQLVGEDIGGAPIFDKAIYAWHYGSTMSFLHGAAICQAAGFDIGVFAAEIASRDAARQTRTAPFITHRKYDDPGCALEVEMVAYDHVLRVSEELGVDTELAQTVARYFHRAKEAGFGAKETAAIFEVLLKDNA